jgi:hypothetical protein
MGKIETQVRKLLATAEVPCMTTSEFCRAVYGEVTKAKRVSMLRVMKKIAKAEPLLELGNVEIRGYMEDGRYNPNKETALYNATNVPAVNRANWGIVDTEADPLDGNYSTKVYTKACMLARGEDPAEFEAAWFAARDARMGKSAKALGALMQGKSPEQQREEQLQAIMAAMIALAETEKLDELSVTLTKNNDVGEWQMTYPKLEGID